VEEGLPFIVSAVSYVSSFFTYFPPVSAQLFQRLYPVSSHFMLPLECVSFIFFQPSRI